MAAVTSITDLPLDVLVIVFPYLDAKSFLAFCATCKAFQQDSIRFDPVYWSHATRATFRVPNQPVVQHDGARWQKLFRRLLTQTRVFTWGNTSHGRLGHAMPQPPPHQEPGRRFLLRYPRQSCAIPVEIDETEKLGIVADMQCGGWSTTFLTSSGSLYIAGVLDGMQQRFVAHARSTIHSLRFPVGFPYSTALAAYEEPTIAIRQFSSGRSHVLGLSDSGRIWSWYDVEKPALHVKFMHVDLTEASSGESSPATDPLFGRVKQVVAGWSCSSAYVHGIGIVLWGPVARERTENDETDTMLVLENGEVPGTAYQRTKGSSRETDEERALGEETGAVVNYIVLEHYVVFVTDIGKAFCARIGDNNQVDEILELHALRNPKGKPLDVQGSFRRFAIFRNEEVITTTQDYLDACWSARHQDPEQGNLQGLQRIPALQHNDVISVAFGDYHFLALHSTGKITSYGKELQSCGSLGLGYKDEGGQLRGIRYAHTDGQLGVHAYTHGRQVWFDPAKREWLEHMAKGGTNPEESAERRSLLARDVNVQGEVSEWVEQEAQHMSTAFKQASENAEDDGLGAYFALSISAAGWHSGALVLHNDKVEEREWKERPFPRLRLSDGREMPGTVDFDEWRSGRPEWQLNTLV